MANGITQFTNQTFRSLAGGILAGQLRQKIGRESTNLKENFGIGRSSNPFSRAQHVRTQYSGTHLTFPFDVEFAPQGHYVLFDIKAYEPAKIDAARKALKTAESALENVFTELRNTQGPAGTLLGTSTGTGRHGIDKAKLILAGQQKIDGLRGEIGKLEAIGGRAAQRSSLRVRSLQTKHTKKRIALYMPPSISTSYKVSYADAEIGIMAETGLAAFQAFMGASGDLTSKLEAGMKAGKGGLRDWAKSTSLKALDTFATGARALHQIHTGEVITPRMELMFESVGRRAFTYTFIFIPKSEREAQEVEKIVYAFKEAMHPEVEDQATSFRSMKIPDTFDIKYMAGGGRNAFLNKISSCFLSSMDVQYGADRFTAYPPAKSRSGEFGSPPQKTQLTLNFSELDILTKKDIQDGF